MRLQSNFQFILRLLNTNVDGKQKVVYALTKIKGVGRRYSNLVCKKADVDLNKRAGELTCTNPHEATRASPSWSQNENANAIYPHSRGARAYRHHHPEPHPVQDSHLYVALTSRSRNAPQLVESRGSMICHLRETGERTTRLTSGNPGFLNRQRDIVDGKDSQVLANGVDSKLRDDLERLKKIRAHRGLRHYWGLRVRGQHTKTTGRRGRTVGVSKKKGG